MNPGQRVVVSLPLAELWNDHGTVDVQRERALGRADVRAMLQSGQLQFVVADPGRPLSWVPLGDSNVFWKADAQAHIVEEPDRPFDIFHFPEGYAYVASEWVAPGSDQPAIVLLERHH